MSQQLHNFQVPLLEEHQFYSTVPVFGPLIGWLRNVAYNSAARWGVRHVIVQQNQINAQLVAQLQALEMRLQEYEVRLIEQDRDLTMLARTLAEVDIRQRYLAKTLTQQDRDGGS